MKPVILFGEKTRRSIIASLYDIPGYPCYCQSRSSRHYENSFFTELIVVCPLFPDPLTIDHDPIVRPDFSLQINRV
jgi:hypothetical protein